jgi:hypothetical protein
MNGSKLRRIRRLKADHAHTIAEYERRKKEWEESLPSLAVDHLLRIIAVFQYGDPRIDEPLALANRRALSKLGDVEAFALKRIRGILKREPPAGDIKSKISARVRQMPDWLLDLCDARISMNVLGIKAPPLPNGASELEQSKSDREAWPFLPHGVLVPRRKREPSFLDEMSFEELLLYPYIRRMPEEQRTRHEQRFLGEMHARGPMPRFDSMTESNQQEHAIDSPDDGADEPAKGK